MSAEPGSEQLIGRELGERYRIDAEIGRGGIGVVYRAIHTKLDRPVALKLLLSETTAPAQRSRFEREAKAMAALKHPNIVEILDCGVSESAPYLVMELLEGQSLAQAFERCPLPLERAERVIWELLSALSYVHACGLMHRDLKPGNVFLQRLPDGGEQVKLLDFGLAKFFDREAGGDTTTLTHSGEVFGTPAYMPPEQWTGQAVDARADVYSAGVVCFEILAGRKPFAGAGQELLRRQLIEDAPLLHEACAERVASPALERLLQRALARQVDDRQRNAAELLAELEAVPRPWLYAGADATPERRAAAGAARAALQLAIAPTVEQGAPVAVPAAASPAPRTSRRNPFIVAARGLQDLMRRIVLAGAWALTAISLFAIGFAVTVIYIVHSPDHDEQRAALEQALPPLRDAVVRGASTAKTAIDQAVIEATEQVSGHLSEQAQAPVDGARPSARARDPWQDPTPQELVKLQTIIDAGQAGDARMIAALRHYSSNHPADPRGHLLLARLYINREAWNEAAAQYEQAFACDSSSRADARMLPDLLRAVTHEVSSDRPSALVRVVYGREALESIARARSITRSPGERARLDRLARAVSP